MNGESETDGPNPQLHSANSGVGISVQIDEDGLTRSNKSLCSFTESLPFIHIRVTTRSQASSVSSLFSMIPHGVMSSTRLPVTIQSNAAKMPLGLQFISIKMDI
jgi:hypothetical protein